MGNNVLDMEETKIKANREFVPKCKSKRNVKNPLAQARKSSIDDKRNWNELDHLI